MNKWLRWFIRVILLGLALYLVFNKISWQQTWQLLLSSNILWLLPALLFYNLSQFVSVRRLLYFYRVLNIPLPYNLNLKLYYKGMFYNLFLPGGIGGDGYKVHFLHKKYQAPVKKLITATLLDRLNGLAILGLLIVIFTGSGILPEKILPFPSEWLIAAYLLLMIFCLWILHKFFSAYTSVISRTTLLSLAVQALQLVSILCILQALHIAHEILAYLLLFLASSVAAVIPFTIGGAGAREIVFMAGAPLLGAISTNAVAVSLLFFLLTVVSSFVGAGIKVRK